MSATAVQSREPKDLDGMLANLRAVRERFLATYQHLSDVIDEAEQNWPRQERVLGEVIRCRHCREPYTEKRDRHSPEYGYCSVKCFDPEIAR